MSDAVVQESAELLLLRGLVEAEVAVSEEGQPQVHGEFLWQDHKGLGVLLLSGCYRNIESTKMFQNVRLFLNFLFRAVKVAF